MTRWNLNDPAVIGPELLGGYDSTTLVSRFAPVVQRFRSNSAETIDAVRLHRSVTAPGGGPTSHLVEVMAAGDEVDDAAAFTVVTYAPNVLTGVVGPVTDEAGGAAVVADFATWPPYYNTTDVRMGTGASLDLEFASAGLVATGRIAAVALEVLTLWGVYPLGNGPDYKRRTAVSLVNGGTLHGTHTRIIPNNVPTGAGGIYFYTWGEINPITGQPWTQADIRAFDTATTRIRLARQTGDTGTWISPAVRLVVVYETTERRLARGAFYTAGAVAAGWTADVDLASPTAVDNWAKANATDYALVLRQADQGNLNPFAGDQVRATTVHAVAGQGVPADLPSHNADTTTITHLTDFNARLASEAITSEAEVAGRVVPFVLRTTAPATSADGQPYAQVRTPGVYTGAGTTEQELRTTVSGDYAGLRLTAGYFPGFPTADLVVVVKRRSDNVTMGTFTITPGDLTAAAPSGAGQLVVLESKAPAPGAALVAGTQYYLSFTSTTPAVTAWIVGLLSVEAGAGGVLYQEATYSGGTDQADPIAGTAATALTYTPADFAAILDAAVTKPAGFTASAALTALPDEQPCELDGIPYVQLGWTVTTLGGDFASYQIDRLGPDAATWEQIANITDETVDGFVDYEARLGVEESYRLRVVRVDGASSYYTDTEVATAAPAGCGYTFTSNEAPEMSVAYPDTYKGRPIRTYKFPEAQEVSFRTMYGRDYQVGFKPLSRRGVTFERHLVIGGLAAPTAGIGPAAAAMIRDLAWATLSYVCVRDQDGSRWFANLRVMDLEATDYGGVTHIHEVNVAVVEITATPAVVDAAS